MCLSIDVAPRVVATRQTFNRELSWISFNWRVLKNSENINIPILERVKFLAI